MPSFMVHLAVAYNILQHVDIEKQNQFYLGAIAPDAIHMRNGSTRQDKSKTHLRSQDNDVWEKRAIKLISDSLYKDDFSFRLGYGVHLLTDMMWFVSVFNNGMKSYDDDPNPIQSYATAYYNDTDCIDTELYKTLTYRQHICELLETAEPLAFDNLLTANEINKWKKRTLSWYDENNRQYKPIKYITMDDINEFIAKSSSDIINILNVKLHRKHFRSIGLKKGTVRLQPHDNAWQKNAAQTILRLNNILNDIIVDAQHIGSTAINHIVAKPIIDIVVGVRDICNVKEMINLLMDNGFFHRPNNDMDDYMMFVCGDMTNEIRTQHIHIVVYGNKEWQDQIAFRDYLNSNIIAAKKYEKLKLELYNKYKNNRAKYTKSKESMILELQTEARIWKMLQ